MTFRKSTTLFIPLLLLLPLLLVLTGCDEDNPSEPDSLDLTPYVEGNRLYAVTTELKSINTQSVPEPVTQLLVYAYRLIDETYVTVEMDSVHVNGERMTMTVDDIARFESPDPVEEGTPWTVDLYLNANQTIQFDVTAMEPPVVDGWMNTMFIEPGGTEIFMLESMGQFSRVDLAGFINQPMGGFNFSHEFYLATSYSTEIPSDALDGTVSVTGSTVNPVVVKEYAAADTAFQVWRYDDFIRHSRLVVTTP